MTSIWCQSLRLQSVALLLLAACGTTDRVRLKESRESFVAGDYAKSEQVLYTPEVLKENSNRALHYQKLASIAWASRSYGKAIYFLQKARDWIISVKSDSGFSLSFGGDYQSNAVEFSYLHFYLTLAHELIADEGKVLAWSTPEIKDTSGNVLIAAQSIPEKFLSTAEVLDYRYKARSELLAWDTHLANLKRTYPNDPYYRDDALARALGSFIHGKDSRNSERRTAELLAGHLSSLMNHDFKWYPAAQTQTESIKKLAEDLKSAAKVKKNDPTTSQSLLVIEAGVMDSYRVQKYHLGLSTIFKHIKDPGLRNLIEQVGIRVILETAPEFGLILVAGAIAGSGQSEDEDQPRYFTDAVDQSFGFQIQFPKLQLPPADTRMVLTLGQLPEIQMPIISPLQEMLSIELKNREGQELFAKALRMGAQYLAVLIPAIQLYRKASEEGNALKKLGILAGFFFAKKAIDSANAPDLRSWDFLPQIIAATRLNVPVGTYPVRVQIQNSKQNSVKDLGVLNFSSGQMGVIHRSVGAF